jgi:hypothetical protein
MSVSEMPKKELRIIAQKEKLSVGRPKVKLVDCMNNSLRMAGVKNWTVEVKDRDG